MGDSQPQTQESLHESKEAQERAVSVSVVRGREHFLDPLHGQRQSVGGWGLGPEVGFQWLTPY